MIPVPALTRTDELMTRHLKSAGYRSWRDKVQATGGCSQPVHMTGAWQVAEKASGTVLARHAGQIFAPCGNRRESVCPACSDRYAADAFHLVRAGLVGGHKGIPATVADTPRLFVTLTAPSFGPVHSRRLGRRGAVIPCRCGERHREADPRIGTAVDPDTYDYAGAVLWQANATALWHRFTIGLRRRLAHAAGLPAKAFKDHARLSYAKVAEYQRRGLIHFHAVIRIDGPDGPTDPPPAWVTAELMRDAVEHAAAAVALDIARPDGQTLTLAWGEQVDIRAITPANARNFEDTAGEITDDRLASYVAKYATKGTGATAGVDRPIRSQLHLDHLTGITEHHRRMIQTAWDLGDRPEYEELNLRKWAHMLGFRGHFLSKSVAYSTTFKNMGETRQQWRAERALADLGVTADTVAVINHWDFTSIGHDDEAQRELAEAIHEQQRDARKRRHEKEIDQCSQQTRP